ncbi:UDP-N-acetylmuramoyl-tripeptide--D-alanyl-D-alanine ligase [Alkalihalobacterium alkalinitrilicum]|uniref:UDP-N-acetylmuramoyl-tripeptide--D-alanyl-D- alanine ligase n=1 Tax=Alkalihalobacterium alkalinitrilicum TaxID=427920 RepID=UPI000994B789|nr:UDP-N-acetylmuramoyl-tripeptide--D-alanyl-D-alanine ligase [Alkalihalobacterium alkalinitrilicum]
MKLPGHLIEAISERLLPEKASISFTGVYTDSRQPMENGLFVPIVGERFDGHNFIHSAIEKGANASLWQKDKPIPKNIPENFYLYLVEDTLQALQQLSKAYLKFIDPIVVGVTGSNGKTTTKDLLDAVLSTTYKTYKTQGNFNNHIGLPLTILGMEHDCELLILEMGMSGYGEIELLSNIAEPHFAVVTNIGESHIEQLGSREGIAKAKMEITKGLRRDGKVIIDGDEPLLHSFYSENVSTCGFAHTCKSQIMNISSTEFGYTFSINGEDTLFEVPLLGRHNIKNAAYAIIIGRELGLTEESIQSGLKQVSLTGMRLERLKGLNGSTIINDAYNASPTSMRAAIEAIKELPGFSKRILILGDMYELGPDESALHKSVASVIDKPITHLFTVGEKGQWILDAFNEKKDHTLIVQRFLNKEDIVETALKLLDENTVVLIKASRGLQLETITKHLM